MMKRRHVFILVIAAVFSSIALGDIPKSGTFNIAGPTAVSFDSIPWTSPNPYQYIYLWPFAADDLYEETEPGSTYNLALATLSAGSFTVADYGEKSGNLGIRIANFTGSTQSFDSCVLTLDFIGSGSFDVYLPEFTLGTGKNMFFWVSDIGETFYANSLKGAGYPDMSAVTAMAAGDEYLVGVIPEPATILLLGLGSLALPRKRKT
ncbi:MAG: PEP-CTERM sorting domain-containing protein [Phycisphaerae bacterium]|jgi:hypothetical protein